MTKNELIQKIQNTPELKGIVIDDCTRTMRDGSEAGQVIVGSFSNTPDWKKTKEILAGMGFRVSPGAADVFIENCIVTDKHI
jgi:hypothetical protein